MKIYCLNTCSTCKKMIKYVDELGIDYELVDIREETPTKEQIKKFHEKSGLEIKRFFNTSGKSYREGNFKERMTEMNNDEIYAEFAKDGMLLKRPIVVTDDFVLVGFKESEYDPKFK